MKICVIGCRWFLDDHESYNSLSFSEKINIAGKNTGNMFIGQAVRHHISRLFPDAEIVEYLSLSQIREDGSGLLAAERYDRIVMAASNMLNPQMDFGFLAKFLEEADLPISIFGIGAQAESVNDRITLNSGTKRFLDYAAANSTGIGVRGSFTAGVLEQNGINKYEIIGCPTGYFNAEEDFRIEVPSLTQDVQRVAVSYKRDRNKYETDRLLRPLQIEMLRLSMENGWDLVAQADFAETWMGYHKEIDIAKLSNMSKYFDFGAEEKDFLSKYVLQHVHSYFRWNEWRGLMSDMDFAFGCRFHGNMMAMNAGTPALFILHDTRTAELCETLRLPGVTVQELSQGPITLERLLGLADYDLFNASFKDACVRFDEFFKVSVGGT